MTAQVSAEVTELGALAAIVRELQDKEAIRDVLYRYCRAVDRCDWDLMLRVFHPDAIDEHGAYVGDIAGFIGFLEGCRGSGSAFDGERILSMTHSIGSMIIDLQGDVALVESYFHCIPVSVVNRRDGSQTLAELHGRYFDRFERRADEWRIAHRLVVKDVRNVHRIAYNPIEDYVDGDIAPRDPTYTWYAQEVSR